MLEDKLLVQDYKEDSLAQQLDMEEILPEEVQGKEEEGRCKEVVVVVGEAQSWLSLTFGQDTGLLD